jgi:hypothetical protein
MSTEDRATEVAETLETGQAAVETAARIAVQKPDRRFVVGVALVASTLMGAASVAVSTLAAAEARTPETVAPVTAEPAQLHARPGYTAYVSGTGNTGAECPADGRLTAELVGSDGRKITGWFCVTSSTPPTPEK